MNPETEARIVDLKKQGCSLGQISAEVGLNRGTISRALRRLASRAPTKVRAVVAIPTPAQVAIRKAAARIRWMSQKPEDKERRSNLWKGHAVGKCPECERRMWKPSEGWPCLACRVTQRTGGAGETD